jgi:hypothetical protein
VCNDGKVSEQLRLRELLALFAAVDKSQGAGKKFEMAKLTRDN